MISVKGEIARRNLKYKDVAAAAGIPATTFYRKLGSNAFSLAEARRSPAIELDRSNTSTVADFFTAETMLFCV